MSNMLRAILIAVIGLMISLAPVLGQQSMAAAACHHGAHAMSLQASSGCGTDGQHRQGACAMLASCSALSCLSLSANDPMAATGPGAVSSRIAETAVFQLRGLDLPPPLGPPRAGA